MECNRPDSRPDVYSVRLKDINIFLEVKWTLLGSFVKLLSLEPYIEDLLFCWRCHRGLVPVSRLFLQRIFSLQPDVVYYMPSYWPDPANRQSLHRWPETRKVPAKSRVLACLDTEANWNSYRIPRI